MSNTPSRAPTGYAGLMRTPGLPALVTLSGIGRLGLGTTSLALILAIARGTGSFTAAGIDTAAFALASAALAPSRGWLADRYGAAPAIGLLGTACGLAVITIIPILHLGVAILAILCAVSGAITPPIGAVTKARLTAIFQSDNHARQLACSLDTVIDISVLVAGPSLAGIIVSSASTDAALATSGALIIVGSIGTATTAQMRRHRSAPQVRASGNRHSRYVFSQPVLQKTVIGMCGMGAAIGAVEVAVPALATRQHMPGESGAVLSVLFAASSLSGLLYGKFHWSAPVTHRYRALTICMPASLIPLTLTHSIPVMAALIALPGLAFGPALVTAFLVAQQSSSAEQRNQANAWIATGNTAGAAIGLAVGGFIAGKAGITPAMLSATLLATAGAIATTGVTRRSSTADRQPAEHTRLRRSDRTILAHQYCGSL